MSINVLAFTMEDAGYAPTIRPVRSFLSRILFSENEILDKLAKMYQNSPNKLVDRLGNEVFVDLDCYEPDECEILFGDVDQAKDRIRLWIRNYLLSPVPDCVKNPRYYTRGRVRFWTCLNILNLQFPEIFSQFPRKPLSSNDNIPVPSNDNPPPLNVAKSTDHLLCTDTP